MNIHELDVVSLKDGREGTVLGLYKDGTVFMIEICDKDGRTIDTPFVPLEAVKAIVYRA